MFSSAQSLSCVRLFVTPWTAASQASLSITNTWSLLKLMSIKSVMPSNHLILCQLLLLPLSIFPRIRVFSNESVLHIRLPKDWSFSVSISPFNEYSGLTSAEGVRAFSFPLPARGNPALAVPGPKLFSASFQGLSALHFLPHPTPNTASRRGILKLRLSSLFLHNSFF